MYAAEPDGRYFYAQNPIRRYSVSERTPGLKRRADGAIVEIVQFATDGDALGQGGDLRL